MEYEMDVAIRTGYYTTNKYGVVCVINHNLWFFRDSNMAVLLAIK